jgi:Asp-tRNA(Asn)/Glu-tRNA(Gln) amidotransferase A subunit family amidase
VAYRPALSHFTSLVNQILLPAIALPLDAPGAPPPSLQLIGPAWSEHRLLGLGRAMEAVGIVVTRRPAGW